MAHASQEQPAGDQPKATYRVKNWSEYNHALIQRGSLTLWFDEEALAEWNQPHQTGKPGHPYDHSDLAIECGLTVKAVYGLAFRQTQGSLQSIMALADLHWSVPTYSTFSRRAKTLDITLPRRKKQEALHVVVDATGLKVYGEGEWTQRTHGKTKRRTWRKIHLGCDEATGEVVACTTTLSNTHEKEELPAVLAQISDGIGQVTGDGGYDYMTCYDAIAARNAKAVIPPRKSARIWDNGQMDARDANLRRIQEVGRKAWKIESDYHRRSLAENGIFRLKLLFGSGLSTRTLTNQQQEVRIRCKAMNMMTHLGMPQSYKVTT
jgi:IS5 family transposase